eukprot:CAMPEP_0167739980 /NCGR_PEP_ID=MMETSP0110_2-20121227/22_1 /TAXON_ID=629695 /ORGANISM="Gymnochlora sp., Strain CCMP2014" /LENGTH=909 /DNA_ID=CAMNT_0007623821 /DNA_START=33 /DNA_END=2762 /DNA_ORIENTATION=-
MKRKPKQQTSSGVTVCCRFRPVNSNEKKRDESKCVVEFPNSTTIGFAQEVFSDLKLTRKTSSFGLDHVFKPGVGQADVFEAIGRGVVAEILNGYNSTIFAYGQTGSGKTHTMMGVPNDPELCGLIPRIVEAIFDELTEQLDATTHDAPTFTVRVSYVEIYMEKIKDLLDPSKVNLKLREQKGKGVWIQDVTNVFVSSSDEVYSLIEVGSANRAIASTEMNAESSRSHSVFILNVEQITSGENGGSTKSATLYLVDLAGSEKVRKTGATGKTLKEAMQINKSLSALGNVIKALTTSAKHVPYRNSKLTRLLSDALGGNCKTYLMLTASPAKYNMEETLSTLRFGRRAKMVQNKPIVNAKLSIEQYEKLLKGAEGTIEKQKMMILALREGKSIVVSDSKTVLTTSDSEPSNIVATVKKLQDKIKLLETENTSLDAKNQEISDMFGTLESELGEKATLVGHFRDRLADISVKYEKSQSNLRSVERSLAAIYDARLACMESAHKRDMDLVRGEVENLRRRLLRSQEIAKKFEKETGVQIHGLGNKKGGILSSMFSMLFNSKNRKNKKPLPPSAQQRITKGARCYVSNSSGVDIREEPALKANLIGVLPAGATIKCKLAAERNDVAEGIYHLWIQHSLGWSCARIGDHWLILPIEDAMPSHPPPPPPSETINTNDEGSVEKDFETKKKAPLVSVTSENSEHETPFENPETKKSGSELTKFLQTEVESLRQFLRLKLAQHVRDQDEIQELRHQLVEYKAQKEGLQLLEKIQGEKSKLDDEVSMMRAKEKQQETLLGSLREAAELSKNQLRDKDTTIEELKSKIEVYQKAMTLPMSPRAGVRFRKVVGTSFRRNSASNVLKLNIHGQFRTSSARGSRRSSRASSVGSAMNNDGGPPIPYFIRNVGSSAVKFAIPLI